MKAALNVKVQGQWSPKFLPFSVSPSHILRSVRDEWTLRYCTEGLTINNICFTQHATGSSTQINNIYNYTTQNRT